MGNAFQRILVIFGFKRTDTHRHQTEPITPVQDFTNIATVQEVPSESVVSHSAQSSKGKQYSWDKRRAAGNCDQSAWRIKGIVNSDVIRLPGSVAGNDLEVQDCKDSRIYIFDNSSQIIVDDCSNSKFIFASVKGNVFFRNCNNCSFIVATSQFRTRDCNNCDFYLYCQTVPIIEASASFKFHCFQLNYEGLKQHMTAAGLACFNNNWSTIHDFTPESGSKNYTLIAPPYDNLPQIFPISGLEEQIAPLNLDFSCPNSCVPSTLGNSVGGMEEALLVIAPSITQLSFGCALVSSICSSESQVKLKQAVLHKMSAEDADRVFGGDFGSLSSSCFESGNLLSLVIVANKENAEELSRSIQEIIEGNKAQFKKLPSHSIFTSKVLIEEMLRFAASQISG